LNCGNNLLTTFDVSNHLALTRFWCYGNQLTTLDVSNNSDLTWFNSSGNQLTSLDVRNGNNVNMIGVNPWHLNFTNNPNLYCIDVDDPVWSSTNWTLANGNIDSTISFSANCNSISGCTDSTAFNYDPTATVDDGTCIAIVYGCTGPTYCNYDSTATTDDGSCTGMLGCIDPLYNEYSPAATCDDGSCLTPVLNACAEDSPTGLNATNVLQNRATINWDNMNDTNCMVDQYRIKFSGDGGATWTQKTMGQPLASCLWAANNTDKLLLNLIPSTIYQYQMKAWYCGGGSSAWSSVETFTTQDDCPNVGNLVVTTGSSTQAIFTWDDSNGAYSFMRIKARLDVTGSTWFNVGGSGVAYGIYTKNKNNLTPGTSYRAQSRTWCDPNGGAWKSPTWTSLIYWTQPTVIRMEGGSSIVNLAIYPNPSRDIFNVSFTSDTKQDLRVRILNLIGEELESDNLEQFIGEYTKQINLSDKAKGIYFLEIETNDGIINKKLILQ